MSQAQETNSWMLYGAYGYTGKLTAEEALRRGMRPILAGRNEEKLRPLAQSLGLDYRVFGLDDPQEVQAQLADVALVLHEAGPFSATSRPMVDACLQSKTHYLDITGEIEVFEAVLGRKEEASEAGVVLMPGVGFDVVPTDCLAALLAKNLPRAERLELAFASLGGGISPGTSKTMVESLGTGGQARVNGRILTVPSAWKSRYAPFWSKARHVVSIPWGDVSTAYHTTGIPNVVTYTAMPREAVSWLRSSDRIGPLLQLGPIQRTLKSLVDWRVEGPAEQALEEGASEVWGEVQDAEGKTLAARLRGPQGYAMTVDASLRALEHVLAGDVEPGAWTPGAGLGPQFLEELDGVEVELLN